MLNDNISYTVYIKSNGYIIFVKSNSWLKKILNKNIGHVLVLLPTEEGFIMIDPSLDRMTHYYIKQTADIANILKKFGHDSFEIIHVNTGIKKRKFILPKFGVFTCTRFIKNMLGIKMFTYSPYHFYKKLKKIEKLGQESLESLKYNILSVKSIKE